MSASTTSRVVVFLLVLATVAGAVGADPASVVVTVRGPYSGELFHKLRQAGGPLVVQLGEKGGNAPIPWELRSRSITGGELISAIAAARNLHVSWLHDGRCAVLYAGVSDETIERTAKELRAPDAATRREGAWRAGSTPDPRIVPLLVHAVTDADPDVAWQAAHSLDTLGWAAAMMIDTATIAIFATDVPFDLWGEFHVRGVNARWDLSAAMTESGEDIVPILEGMIRSENSSIRVKAANVLRALGHDAGEALLVTALASTDITVRTVAAVELAHRGHADALGVLRTDLGNPDGNLHQNCLLALVGTGGHWNWRLPSDAPTERGDGASRGISAAEGGQLLALADKIENTWFHFPAQLGIAYALGWGREPVLEMLDKDLADPRRNVRQRATLALEGVSSDLALPRLEKAFHDAEAIVRYAALSAVGSVGGERAMAMAEEAYADPDGMVRGQVGRTWCAIGGDRALEALKRLSTAPDVTLRIGCANALGQTVGEQVMALADTLLEDPNHDVRHMAIMALVSMGGHLAMQRLAVVADSSSAKTRAEAIPFLGWMDGDDVMTILDKALMDPNSKVRTAAVQALAGLGDDRAIGMMIGMIADPNPGNRLSALQALSDIGDPRILSTVKPFIADHDARMRMAAMMARLSIGGSQMRGTLLDFLTTETDPSIIPFLASLAARNYPSDAELSKAAAAARARIKPLDKPKVQAAPVKGDANDF